MNRLFLLLLALGLLLPATTSAQTVFINEINYDPPGTDAGEFLEIAGPAGTDLSAYSIVLYNGANGQTYDTDILVGIIPNQQNGFGTATISYPSNGLQNGSPDGVALVQGGAVIQFLCYEGTFAAANGPASGSTCTDIGVSQNNSSTNTASLTGSGSIYSDFSWALASISGGAVNPGQTFVSVGNDTVVQFGSAGATEDETNADFTIDLPITVTNPSATPVDVTVDFVEGSSTGTSADIDGFTGTTVTIPGNTASGVVTITVTGDALEESTETFVFEITAVSGGSSATIGNLSTYTLTVNDDDTPIATFVRINEVDPDTPGGDQAEFIELYDLGVGTTSLTGLALVHINGSNNQVAFSIDLDPYSTDASGLFLAGNPGLVPVEENPVQGTASSPTAIESDVERAKAQREADLKQR